MRIIAAPVIREGIPVMDIPHLIDPDIATIGTPLPTTVPIIASEGDSTTTDIIALTGVVEVDSTFRDATSVSDCVTDLKVTISAVC